MMSSKEKYTSQQDALGDRGSSVVAAGKNTNTLAIIVMFVVAGILVSLVFLGKDDESKNTLVDVQDESFNTGVATKFDVPKTIDISPPPALIEEPLVDKPDPDLLKLEEERLLAQLRFQEEMQRLLAARRRSPSLIYDKAAKKQGLKSEVENINQSNINSITADQLNHTNNKPLSPKSNNMVTANLFEDLFYIIGQGKMISGIMETAINSDLPGMVRAIVSEDIYSENGENILMPRGSRLVGEYRSGLTFGQTRLFVIWSRIIRPDGIHIALGSPGTDSLGRSGLTGIIDNHYIERFGAAVALSIIGSLAATKSDSEVVLQDTAESLNTMAQTALEKTIGIPPTIHLDQGARIKVFIAKDLNFKSALIGTMAEN